jgi:hypothetical protein
MTAEIPPEAIELRVDKIAQLFHSLDPYPFRERDLDKDAEDYIVGWARELDADQPITIVIHAPQSETQSKEALELRVAFARYFAYRADSLQRELKELFRVGRRSLVIGMTILAACLLSAHFLAGRFSQIPSSAWSRRACCFSAGSPIGARSRSSSMIGGRSCGGGISTAALPLQR